MSASNLSWLKKKSQSVDITAPGFNPLGGAAKPAAQTSKVPSVAKTPTIVEEENNTDNAQKRNPRRSELKRFYTIGSLASTQRREGPSADPGNPGSSTRMGGGRGAHRGLARGSFFPVPTAGTFGSGRGPFKREAQAPPAPGTGRVITTIKKLFQQLVPLPPPPRPSFLRRSRRRGSGQQRLQPLSEGRAALPDLVSLRPLGAQTVGGRAAPGPGLPRDGGAPPLPRPGLAPRRRRPPPPPARACPATAAPPPGRGATMEYLSTFTGKGGRLLRGTANRLWGLGSGVAASSGSRQVRFEDYLREETAEPSASELGPSSGSAGTPPFLPGSDTGQKKTLDKKDGRRMSFQKPKGTIEYTVESRDSLNSIALKFDTTPNELVQLNKLFSRAVVTGQVLYVPDPEYVSSVESSPSLSPISPLSPTSSEPEFDKPRDTDGVHQKETTPSSAFTCVRSTRVVSSTSEEEEAFTEKFLKINCKYITSGKGTVSGVLLVTPNNIMFDPHKTDPLVQENGCEEYGIMCPMEEVMSAAMYKEILDSKIKESLPIEVDQLSVRDLCYFKKMTRSNTDDIDSRIRDTGNDSASTAPRSTEESLSEDVFTESELSPIREELISSDELRQDKSSGASSESVQTVQASAACVTVISDSTITSDNLKGGIEQPTYDVGLPGHVTNLDNPEVALKEDPITNISQQSLQETKCHKENNMGVEMNTNKDLTLSQISVHGFEDEKENSHFGELTESQKKETVNKGKQGKEQIQDSETEVEELRKLWKSHTMQQTKQQRENIQQVSQKEIKHKIAPADGHIEGSGFLKEKRRHRLHKFLCLRVGKPMRKTFVSQASATMQQYAQRDKKHEYWFAVPQERTDHLYAFFIQWSPETYAEDTGEFTREPGFIVVKKIEEPETTDDSEAAAREWEVVSVAEYHRRIDALNTEELRTLCRRLQITTREDVNSKQATPVKAELESEAFRPNLSDPSELLLPDQIEKLTKHLPPRTIGYPWTLVYGTGKHGTSLKTLYRTMLGLDTPVLMVIKDSDGQVFGALASEPFKVSDCFYGTGETFVFTFSPEFEVFKWTGDNMFFIKGDMDSLAFGGGGGEFALWLDGDLYHGRSHSCKTFGNHTLSKKEDFFIQDIEIWAFE